MKPGEAPARVEFGVRSQLEETSARPVSGPIALDAATVTAFVKGLLGSAVTFVIMSVIGLFIYLLVFRRRLNRIERMPSPAALSPMRPSSIGHGAPAVDSRPGADPPGKHVPSAGSPAVFADDQTDAPETYEHRTRPKDR